MELVEAQRAGKRHTHIPYRDSRLTFLLQVRQLLCCLLVAQLHAVLHKLYTLHAIRLLCSVLLNIKV